MAESGCIKYDQIRSSNRQGDGSLIQMAGAGSKTGGHVLIYDANGNAIDGGTPAFGSPTTTKGDLIVRGASVDSRLGVGADTYVLTADSAQSLGLKWAASGGGGGGVSNVAAPSVIAYPVAGNFAWANQGTATVSGGSGTPMAMNIPDQGGNDRLAAQEISMPVGAWTVDMVIDVLFPGDSFGWVGFIVRDSTHSTAVTFGWARNVGTPGLEYTRWSGPSGGFYSYGGQAGASLSLTNYNCLNTVRCLRLNDDGANFNFSWSPDGNTWYSIISVSRTAQLTTPSSVGWGGSSRGGGNVFALLWSWYQH